MTPERRQLLDELTLEASKERREQKAAAVSAVILRVIGDRTIRGTTPKQVAKECVEALERFL